MGKGKHKIYCMKICIKKLKQEKIREGFGVPSAKGEQPLTDKRWQRSSWTLGLFSFYMEYCKCFNQSPAALMKINQNLPDPAHCTCSEHACTGHRVGGPPRGIPLSALQRTGAGFRSWLELWKKLCVCVSGVGVQMEAAELSTSQT